MAGIHQAREVCRCGHQRRLHSPACFAGLGRPIHRACACEFFLTEDWKILTDQVALAVAAMGASQEDASFECWHALAVAIGEDYGLNTREVIQLVIEEKMHAAYGR